MMRSCALSPILRSIVQEWKTGSLALLAKIHPHNPYFQRGGPYPLKGFLFQDEILGEKRHCRIHTKLETLLEYLKAGKPFFDEADASQVWPTELDLKLQRLLHQKSTLDSLALKVEAAVHNNLSRVYKEGFSKELPCPLNGSIERHEIEAETSFLWGRGAKRVFWIHCTLSDVRKYAARDCLEQWFWTLHLKDTL
ncbi:MAG: hypothetical protein KGJ02_01645 [Verrucomicrobiota bacterium]|nr:hypothetical protein [Verrucomicrobiota bacterium]